MPKISHCCGEKIVRHSITGQKICSRCGYCAEDTEYTIRQAEREVAERRKKRQQAKFSTQAAANESQ